MSASRMLDVINMHASYQLLLLCILKLIKEVNDKWGSKQPILPHLGKDLCCLHVWDLRYLSNCDSRYLHRSCSNYKAPTGYWVPGFEVALHAITMCEELPLSELLILCVIFMLCLSLASADKLSVLV